eukprot:TRINITY_DN3785_c5_g1_i1.p1 TRINITY_DN3785_c5_g1~~TRINITY_DN3785_c5_g1_i1.p1  ORF type:complete len:122 (+),score=18.18 TRINITY_DN3785_c5_g1_i1:55-420(+)
MERMRDAPNFCGKCGSRWYGGGEAVFCMKCGWRVPEDGFRREVLQEDCYYPQQQQQQHRTSVASASTAFARPPSSRSPQRRHTVKKNHFESSQRMACSPVAPWDVVDNTKTPNRKKLIEKY